MEEQQIRIKKARVHNLKNISLDIPHDKITVITGLSGSGKSSLAFDTIYAEGHRRYIESLSSYARQFFGRLDKPDVDQISGIPPAIAIRQKVGTRSPRSTVGTLTEIYDYMKLLYARVGKTYSPISGQEVKRHTTDDIVTFLKSLTEGSKIYISAPFEPGSTKKSVWVEMLQRQGYRMIYDGKNIVRLTDYPLRGKAAEGLCLILDRIKLDFNTDKLSRIRNSIEQAFNEGKDRCCIFLEDENGLRDYHFSKNFTADGLVFEEPTEHLFSFNNPLGACPECEGYGMVIGIDEDLVVPDKNLSVYDNAIVPWKGEKMSKWKDQVVMNAAKVAFPVHRPYIELSEEEKELLWQGCKAFYGINDFFAYLEKKKYKIQYRVMLARYRGKTICPVCRGKRLKKEAGYVTIQGKSIPDLVDMPVEKLKIFFDTLTLKDTDAKIAERILREIRNRLYYMNHIGLGYLSLNRKSGTLSGGETQRINLVTFIGSSLVGSAYILDEPSIGLHPRDIHLLADILKELRNLKNTIIVVEHEEQIITHADEILDIGHGAGYQGGEIVFHGSRKDMLEKSKGLTADYLTGRKEIPLPARRQSWQYALQVNGARQHNLKNIDLKIPLEVFCVITGVSGSGKTTLVRDIVYPALKNKLEDYSVKPGLCKSLEGDWNILHNVQYVDQNPIGKSSRSNPVTYIKAYDEIRNLFAEQPLAKRHKMKPAYFSFNVDGGRCEECKGEGQIRVEMQFMADVFLTCEACQGKRFKEDVLEVRYKGKNIHDILEMTVDQAVSFFDGKNASSEKRITKLLQYYQKVGLGYVKLGQASNTLSGGESQRIKLASFLSREKQEPGMFIFDEPTTGLHFHDIHQLLNSFFELRERGNSILVIEHNPEIVKSADWVIDLGPEGGEKGGNIVFSGTPDDLPDCEQSYTGKYIREKLR